MRRKAEEKLAERESQIESLERADLESLAHELAVHQVELEIQNEELRRTRLEAEEARDRYLDLFDFAPVGYFTLDEHNRIVEANLTGCQLLKIDRKSLLRKSFTKFINPEESDRFYLHRRKVLESGIRQTGELQMQKADGTPFYAQIESLKVGEERLRLAVIDITERKQAEGALQKYARDLENANKELESFSYSITHDLRQPLRALESFSGLLSLEYKDKLDETGRDYVNRINKASQYMYQLTDDMLKLSRINRADLYRDKVNLSELSQSILNELKTSQPERKVEINITQNLMVTGDKNLLTIAMRNLLENTWKFTSKCHQTRIEIGQIEKDGEKVYYIRDNGIGFDTRFKDKLFQPFQRLTKDKDYPGTGIGLAIVQRVIHRHGGKVWAEAELDHGATFYFTLG